MNYPKGIIFILLVLWSSMVWGGESKQQVLPTYDEVIRAKTDLWGEAALRQENGASYEFFEKLLPPLRYVNATFKHYPIVLSAPKNPNKARFVSNGSGINLTAHTTHGWKDVGFPVSFRVGDREEIYGGDLRRLDGPHFADGFLPVVQLNYREYDGVYGQEAFLSTDPAFADNAAVFVKFSLDQGKTGKVTAQIKLDGRMKYDKKSLLDEKGNVLLLAGGDWQWDEKWRFVQANITPGEDLFLVVFTQPMEKEKLPNFFLTGDSYQQHRERTIMTWRDLLARGMQVQTPEKIVNNAWRSHIIGDYLLIRDNQMCYSAHNQYERVYILEGGDAVRSLMYWGQFDDARQLMLSIIDPVKVKKGLKYHQAGLKLSMLSQYYWQTRDSDYVNSIRDHWAGEVDCIMNERDPNNGLVPPERYAGDIDLRVDSLRSNALAWRGLRDAGVMLDEMGQKDQAGRIAAAAQEYRKAILAGVDKYTRRDVDPPFIPMAFGGVEEPYDAISDSVMGAYWNLIAGRVLGSGVFPPGTEQEKWLIDYIHRHGGLCMGMIRFRSSGDWWDSRANLDDLYGARYVATLLRNDDVERALVSFYGKLAQGCTRDTFIGGEGTCLTAFDEYGRQISLPPNSSSNSFFLRMLRHNLVQDWDMNDDGKPDILRLMYATPRRWLMDGQTIKVERAPTAFGEVSVVMRSELKKGEVIAEVTAPPRPCPKMLLRARVPEGWKITTASVKGSTLPVDANGAVDVTGRTGKFVISFKVVQE